MQTIFLLSLGAVLGANLRYWLGIWTSQRWQSHYPVATLLINLTGSLLLGFFLTVVTERILGDPQWRIFFAVGFLGSFTTFSTYTYESIALLLAGNWISGLFHLFGSALLGGFAAIAGVLLGRML